MAKTSISICVLPFRNLSSEPDTEYFANGFIEDLMADLTKFPSLRVLAAQSAFALQQTDRPIDEFAREWGLEFLLQGSVRRDKTSLRVGVQLIRVEELETVWAERFDVPLDKVFEIQDEIVAKVAGQLAVHVVATAWNRYSCVSV